MAKLKLDRTTLIAFENGDLSKMLPALERCLGYCDFAKVKLLSCHDMSNVSIDCEKIPVRWTSYREYNRFMLGDIGSGIGYIGDYVDTEFMLLIQWDGYILNPDAWSDEFYEYDYIGAVWDWHTGPYRVGNGGFTLRSKKLMDIIKNDPRFKNSMDNEDWYICNIMRPYLETMGCKFAPEHIARRFSIETGTWNGEFGGHCLNRYPKGDHRDVNLDNWEGDK